MVTPLQVIVPADQQRATIQGKTAGSANEGFVANALDQLGHQYFYQFRVFSISGVRGDYTIDFLVTSTVPQSTPVEVFGDYWHSGELGAEDQFRIAQIEDHFRGDANDVVILWGNQTDTQDKASDIVRSEIGPA